MELKSPAFTLYDFSPPIASVRFDHWFSNGLFRDAHHARRQKSLCKSTHGNICI